LIKTPVAIQPAYTIYYEEYEHRTFTHADVYKWTPVIAKEFKMVHALLQQIHSDPFYCLVDNPKLEKFVKFLGYKFLKEVICTDGAIRRIFKYG
jgi:hypothetical protein